MEALDQGPRTEVGAGVTTCKSPVNSLAPLLVYADGEIVLLQPEVCCVGRNSIGLESIQTLPMGARRPSQRSAI